MRWTRSRALVGCVAGVAAAVALVAPVSPASAHLSPSARSVPRFNFRDIAPASDGLSGISCVTASFCVAVGHYVDPIGFGHSLAEEWNGASWRVLPGVTGSGLSDVSCTSKTFCMAIGSAAERWNGRRWSALPVPAGISLIGVSCIGTAFCMAVGSGKQCEAAAVWRGTAWHALRMPSPCGPPSGGLVRVSCVSASRCVAVGNYMPDNEDQLTLAEGWNGTRWRLLGAPSPGDHAADQLSGVSCPTRSFCMAVGGVVVETSSQCDSEANLCDLALTWNGSAWNQLPTPGAGGPGLAAVSCADASHCVAIGTDQAFSWNGAAWTPLTIAQPGTTSLADLSCARHSACMAVGSYGTIDNAQLALAEQWAGGSTWRARRTPSPGDAFNGLSGVSCPSRTNCVAVGNFMNGSDRQLTLAEKWNGRSWRVLPTSSPGPHVNVTDAVSCPTASDCTAVGYYDSAGQHQAFAEQWNGTSWQAQSVPHLGSLTAISCVTASDCVAVGSYLSASKRFALAATWNGTAWTVQPSPTPSGSLTEFNGISCSTAEDCIAVGDYNTGVATPLLPLSARWNGTSLTMLTTPDPGGADGMAAVSCTSPSNCMAVGSYFHQHGHDFPIRTLAESWNGSNWRVRATPPLTGQPHLDAVACAVPARTASVRCIATGDHSGAGGRGFALAESWNGTRWSFLPTPSPSFVFNDLYGISCPAASHCVAVGENGVQRTFAILRNGSRWSLLRTPSP